MDKEKKKLDKTIHKLDRAIKKLNKKRNKLVIPIGNNRIAYEVGDENKIIEIDKSIKLINEFKKYVKEY